MLPLVAKLMLGVFVCMCVCVSGLQLAPECACTQGWCRHAPACGQTHAWCVCVCVCVSVACSWLLSVLARRGGAGMLPLVAKLMLDVFVCVCVSGLQLAPECACMQR